MNGVMDIIASTTTKIFYVPVGGNQRNIVCILINLGTWSKICVFYINNFEDKNIISPIIRSV